MEDVYARKPWLKFYDKHVPPTMEYPRRTYAEVIRDVFQEVPDRVALYYMGKNITFRQLDHLSNQLAHYLVQIGCRPGDTVGVHMPNIPECYIAAIAIQKAGCVFTGVSALLTGDELEYQLNDSGAKALVTVDILFGTVGKVAHKTGIKTVVVGSIGNFLPTLKRVLGKLLKKIPTGEVTPLSGIQVVRFLESLRGMPTDPLTVKVDPEAPCLMMYTGGTTGRPKGAVLTHNNIVHHMAQWSTWNDSAAIGEGTGLSAFPLFHQAGNFMALLSLALGYSLIVIPNPRDLKFMISAMTNYRPTYVVNVPTIFLELMKLPEFRGLDFSNVQYFLSGASPFPGENIKEFEGIVGKGKLIEVYGMTETSPVLTSLPRYGTKKVGSVGIPLSDTEVKLVDPETKEAVPLGQPGELAARGPQVFTKGYHNKPEETAHALRDGWIYTGDVAVMDEDGYFYIVDRLKDMVSVSGFKVFTRQVDDVLVEHPDVDLAATIGLPDPKRPGSEIVASAIVLKPGREKSDEMKQKITGYMKEKVSPYKVPKVIEFMDQMPMSAVGKVLKRELRQMMAGK